MRARLVTTLALLVGCNSSGTMAQQSSDAGADSTLADAGGDAEDASEEADVGPPCMTIVQGNPIPSLDCVFAGSCPADCAQGTAGAYACNAASVGPDAGGYPSAFQAPSGIVSVVGFENTAYPWDAAAWVSCRTAHVRPLGHRRSRRRRLCVAGRSVRQRCRTAARLGLPSFARRHSSSGRRLLQRRRHERHRRRRSGRAGEHRLVLSGNAAVRGRRWSAGRRR